jgi:hypothetical protein
MHARSYAARCNPITRCGIGPTPSTQHVELCLEKEPDIMKISSVFLSLSPSLLPPLAFLSVALAGAGSARSADAGAPAAPAAAAAPAQKIDWENMKFEERKKYMKSTVLPTMKKEFQAFDAKAFKKFSCATCHGDGATDGKFKMPNPKLPKLPQPTDRAGFMALQQKKPELVKFMGTVVKPKVAGLLGLPEWSPQNPKGFGCYECHTKEEPK